MNLVDLKERIAIVDGFSPAERDFILDLINKRAANNRWPWTCGHLAGAMCQKCYRLLALRAAKLAAENDRLREIIQNQGDFR
jgi:hypothetical protein